MKHIDQDTWRLLRLPLDLVVVGAVTVAGAQIWNMLSCCEGGANIGAGMLWLVGLVLLVGGGLWGVVTVIAGRIDRR